MSRISPGTVIVGIFAVLFGLVGAYAVRNSMQPAPEVAPVAPVLNDVPIASLDLEPGRRVTMGDIAILRLTAEQIREQAIPDGYMINPQQIIGRTLRDEQAKGKPFFTDQLYPEGVGPTISARLKPGFRAVTVEIANEAAVAGLAPPGSYVDVYFRTTIAKTPDLPETTITLLENVEVLALGPNIIPGIPAATAQMFGGNVTLAVSPEQASALKVVEGRGELMLALRSPDDVDLPSDIGPETLEGLLGVIIEPAAIPTQTTIYRGVNNQTVQFSVDRVADPVRITARPIRARSSTVSDVPEQLRSTTRMDATADEPTEVPTEVPTDGAAEVPTETISPTSSLDPIHAPRIARNPQAAPSITPPKKIVTRASPIRPTPIRATPTTTVPTTTVHTATIPTTTSPRASIRSKMVSGRTTPETPEITIPTDPASIRSKMASTLPTTVRPIVSASAQTAPAITTPEIAAPATTKPVIEIPRTPVTTTPVTTPASSTPTKEPSSKKTAGSNLRGENPEVFRSVFFAGTQAEERIYENGKLASRIPVASDTQPVNDTAE